jgi:hypothetical protein
MICFRCSGVIAPTWLRGGTHELLGRENIDYAAALGLDQVVEVERGLAEEFVGASPGTFIADEIRTGNSSGSTR